MWRWTTTPHQTTAAVITTPRFRTKGISEQSRITDRDMSAQERDIVAAANVDTFAGMGDRTGEVQAAMGDVGYGGPNWA